jgi:hypothetical protein
VSESTRLVRVHRIEVVIVDHDGAPWRCAGILRDGRAFYLEAGCDYTGWDCQASGTATVAEDWDRLVQFGMGSDARTLWGLG